MSKMPERAQADGDQRERRPEQHQPGAARPRRRHVGRRRAAASRPAAGCRGARSVAGSYRGRWGCRWCSWWFLPGWCGRGGRGCPRAAGAGCGGVPGARWPRVAKIASTTSPMTSSGNGKPEAPAVAEERGAEDDHQRDHAGDDQDDPADVGAELDRARGPRRPRARTARRRRTRAGPGAAEEGEHGEQHPDDRSGRCRSAGRGRRRHRRCSGRSCCGAAGRRRASARR